ncbi:hypothetical protein L3X38_010795 [Prunus dulcis]|uniref:Uncharacterized protein n=1 Tax=Prunus dulcis TaxID=3755 RepID=A0AAD4WHT2_PRUDU|nr:hypothetical protein L3X38_010795 [Prunus dulcis]
MPRTSPTARLISTTKDQNWMVVSKGQMSGLGGLSSCRGLLGGEGVEFSADVIISGSSPGEFCPWACPVSWGPPVARAGLEALEADSGLLLPFAWASLKRWACSYKTYNCSLADYLAFFKEIEANCNLQFV